MSTPASALTTTSSARSTPIAYRLLAGLCATLVVAAAARVAFPLPFTPVPFTLQPLAVLGVGLALGPLDGLLTMLAYLAEGAAGLPVFSPTGPGGILQLFGATGGYLMCYPAVAFAAGAITRHLQARLTVFRSALVGCGAATAFLFLCGATWLAHVAHLNAKTVWLAAIVPFLPGEAVKVFAAAGIYRALKRPISR